MKIEILYRLLSEIPSMDSVLNKALSALPNVRKPQKAFIALLLSTLSVFQGKATFRNLSRYSNASEKRFSRWFRRTFNFVALNWLILSDDLSSAPEWVAALDASFVKKSGKKTEGLGMFYNGCAGRAEQGLEVSLLSLVNLSSNTAYALDAQQTVDEEGKSRTDLYAEQVKKLAKQLLKNGIKHLAADAYYFKKTFVTPVMETGLHVISKLRKDAYLRWAYTGPYSGRGRPKTYDGVVNLHQDLDRFEAVGNLDSGEEIYTARVHSRCLKCWIKVVMLRIPRGDKVGIALLFSTNTELDAMTIIRYYKARFQIEFVFRDAKQYTGLTDCQCRSKEAIHTHINASLTALNLLKLADAKEKNTAEQTVISIASWKRRKYNEHLMRRVFDELGLPLSDEKVMNTYRRLNNYGAIAA